MKKALLILVIISIFSSCKDQTTEPPVVPYAYVTIGSQVWMKRNLDVDHYRNGDSIPEVKDFVEWANLTTGAWCFCTNSSINGDFFGKLYNWYAVNDPRGLAPFGWHIPSDDEWSTLTKHLGGAEIAGGKLKDTGTTLWQSPNIGATNEFGFSALPGGCRDKNYDFVGIGPDAFWWSSTESHLSENSYYYNLYSSGVSITRLGRYKQNGFSVRCIKN